MKTILKVCAAALAMSFCAIGSVRADDHLPNSGVYFVVNRATGEALQPVAASQGQNVELFAFNKGGLQKWAFTRQIDPVTKKPTNRYNIRVAGDVPGLELQPHDIGDVTALVQETKSVFVLQPTSEGMLIQSSKKNGDAMYSYPVANMATEARFAPSDGSAKFMWDVQPAEDSLPL